MLQDFNCSILNVAMVFVIEYLTNSEPYWIKFRLECGSTFEIKVLKCIGKQRTNALQMQDRNYLV